MNEFGAAAKRLTALDERLRMVDRDFCVEWFDDDARPMVLRFSGFGRVIADMAIAREDTARKVLAEVEDILLDASYQLTNTISTGLLETVQMHLEGLGTEDAWLFAVSAMGGVSKECCRMNNRAYGVASQPGL